MRQARRQMVMLATGIALAGCAWTLDATAQEPHAPGTHSIATSPDGTLPDDDSDTVNRADANGTGDGASGEGENDEATTTDASSAPDGASAESDAEGKARLPPKKRPDGWAVPIKPLRDDAPAAFTDALIDDERDAERWAIDPPAVAPPSSPSPMSNRKSGAFSGESRRGVDTKHPESPLEAHREAADNFWFDPQKFPTLVVGFVGVAIGMALPMAVSGLGGALLASVLSAPSPDGCAGFASVFVMGIGFVAGAPLGVLGGTSATVIRQLVWDESVLPSVLGGAVGIGAAALGLVVPILGITMSARIDDPDFATLFVVATLAASAAILTVAGPVAVGVTVFAEETQKKDEAKSALVGRQMKERPLVGRTRPLTRARESNGDGIRASPEAALLY